MDASPPIFILSGQRSGSTLLRFILDTHPEIYCPPELFTGQVVRSWVMFHLALLGPSSARELGGEHWQVADEIREPLRALILDRLAEHTQRRGKILWCDKSTNNIEHAGLLEAVFPEARYICLHRHCLDVVASAARITDRIAAMQSAILRSGGHFLAGLIRWWCEVTNNLLALEEEHPERCFRLRYEDLVQAPAATLEPLFVFLGVAWDPVLPEVVFATRHEQGVGDAKIWREDRIHTKSVGTGRALGLDGVPAPLLDEMRALLRELGYPEEVRASATASRTSSQ